MGKREEKGYQSPIVLPERMMNIFYFLEMKENLMGSGKWDDKELLLCVCCGNFLDSNLSPVPKIPDFGNTTGFFLNTENEVPDLSFSRVLTEF